MIQDSVLVNDWHAVASSTDVPEGSLLGVRLLDEYLVVWRMHGRLMAWQDLCVHRGTRLSLGAIEGENLVCGYHGWTYNTEGDCVSFPAHPEQKPPPKARVRTYKATERYGLIWVCLGEDERGVPKFEEWEDGSFRKLLCGPYRYHASGPRAVENFLDVAHLPIVHSGLLGEREHAKIEDYQVETSRDGLIARNVQIWQPDPDGTGVGKKVVYTYQVLRPLTMRLSKDAQEGRHAIFATVTPVGEIESVAWFWVAMNYALDTPEQEVVGFQDTITSQDIPVVESQRPELLPLDLQAELHLRSDKMAVAYRKWLSQLGMTFGTA
ncbi:MAG TPA: aromatic ring-hydroxylating dioxygenase subunit alpha [Nitrososphaerales archaeon]|nr:aromatic ring-hydroxylating dioxygenase subunit alpha [Nitrososphaerales archaeon]